MPRSNDELDAIEARRAARDIHLEENARHQWIRWQETDADLARAITLAREARQERDALRQWWCSDHGRDLTPDPGEQASCLECHIHEVQADYGKIEQERDALRARVVRLEMEVRQRAVCNSCDGDGCSRQPGPEHACEACDGLGIDRATCAALRETP